MSPITIDPKAPMAALEEAGASWERHTTTEEETFTLNGIPLNTGSNQSVVYEWTLPRSALVQADFCPEGLLEKFKKIFREEIQLGDPEFDEAVYITTREREATRSFLQPQALRDIVLGVISQGGRVSIDNVRVRYQLTGPVDQAAEVDMARFIAAVINLG